MSTNNRKWFRLSSIHYLHTHAAFSNPTNNELTTNSYPDAPTEGVRRVLEWFTGEKIPRHQPIDTSRIEFLRMGTTVATNALLERKGERCALLIVSKTWADSPRMR